MDKNNKLDMLDLTIGAAGVGIINYAKDPFLGVTTLYHGTSKKNAEGIKREGLLIEKANSQNGATAWLKDLVADQETEHLKLNKGKYSFGMPELEGYKNLYPYSPKEVEKLVNIHVTDPHKKQLMLDALRNKQIYQPVSDSYILLPHAESIKLEPGISKSKPVDSKIDFSKFRQIDDTLINEANDAVTKEIFNNTKGHVFVTKHRPHANLYSYMSKPGRFKEFIKKVDTIANTYPKDMTTEQEKELAKKIMQQMGIEYIKAQNAFVNDGVNVKIKMPTVRYEKNFTLDSIALNDEVAKSVETMKNERPLLYKVLKNFQAKSPNDVSTKYIQLRKRPLVYAEAVKELPQYIKAHPVKFGAGLAGVALGGYLLKDPVTKLYDNYI